MQSATNVREAAGQPPLVPCASSNDLLVVGALLVADREVFLGQYSKEQRAGEWPVWQTELHNPSFAAFAKLCGGHGARVTDTDKIRSALRTLGYTSGV